MHATKLRKYAYSSVYCIEVSTFSPGGVVWRVSHANGDVQENTPAIIVRAGARLLALGARSWRLHTCVPMDDRCASTATRATDHWKAIPRRTNACNHLLSGRRPPQPPPQQPPSPQLPPSKGSSEPPSSDHGRAPVHAPSAAPAATAPSEEACPEKPSKRPRTLPARFQQASSTTPTTARVGSADDDPCGARSNHQRRVVACGYG